MHVAIRGYRGIERADFSLDAGIVLFAGRNFAGKSSICQAVGAAFTKQAIPFFRASKPDKPALTKADAKGLLRGGMDKGSVVLSNGSSQTTIEWPSGNVTGDGSFECSKIAAGLINPLDLEDSDRQRLFASLLDSEPSFDDFKAACKDAGVLEARAAHIWKELQVQGWDVLAKSQQQEGAILKGKWEAFSRTKWGAKKAAEWRPDGWRDELVGQSEEALATIVSAAQQQLERAIASQAVDAAKVEQLTKDAQAETDYQVRMNRAHDLYASALGEQGAAESTMKSNPIPTDHACPHCGGMLEIQGNKVVQLDKDAMEERRKRAGAARVAYEQATAKVREQATSKESAMTLLNTVKGSKDALAKARNATGRPEAVDAARVAHSAADADLERWKAVRQCSQIHADITLALALADVLSPEGLRRQKLTKALEKFNRLTLAELCASAEYPPITVDAELMVRYNGRPFYLLSESEKYRVRAVLQVAIALLEGSPAVILDGADILDDTGRNGLFCMLDSVKALKVIVAMTLNKNEDVPNLRAAEMGDTIWVEDGVAKLIQ